MSSHSHSKTELTFGEETVVITRRWGYDTRVVALRLLDEDKSVEQIGEALGRDPLDVFTFAIRCAPKLRALAPSSSRARLVSKEAGG